MMVGLIVVPLLLLLQAPSLEHLAQAPAIQQEQKADRKRSKSNELQRPPAPTEITIKGPVTIVEQPKPDQKERDAEQKAHEKFSRWVQAIALVLAGVAAVGAIGAYRANRRQARAAEEQAGLLKQSLVEARADATAQREETRKQYTLSRATAQRELCAYVFAPGAQLWNVKPGIATPGASAEEKVRVAKFSKNGPIAMVKIENFGRTPAYSFSAEIWMRRANPSTPDLPRAPHDPTEGFGKPFRRAILPPGSHIFQMEVEEKPLTDEERLSIQNGTAAWYVYGEIRYRDVFNIGVTSWFRFVHTADQYGTHGIVIADDGNFEKRGEFQLVMNTPWPP